MLPINELLLHCTEAVWMTLISKLMIKAKNTGDIGRMATVMFISFSLKSCAWYPYFT